MAYLSFDRDSGSSEDVSQKVKIQAIIKIFSLFGFAIVLGIFIVVRGLVKGRVSQVTVSDSLENSSTVPYKIPFMKVWVCTSQKSPCPKTLKGYVDTCWILGQ
jgi:hypothetical protein